MSGNKNVGLFNWVFGGSNDDIDTSYDVSDWLSELGRVRVHAVPVAEFHAPLLRRIHLGRYGWRSAA